MHIFRSFLCVMVALVFLLILAPTDYFLTTIYNGYMNGVHKIYHTYFVGYTTHEIFLYTISVGSFISPIISNILL